MKKILLAFTGLVFGFASIAQSFQFINPKTNANVTGTTVAEWFPDGSLSLTPDIKIYVKNVNSTSDSIRVDLKRYELAPLVDSTRNYFCWGFTCLGESLVGSQPIRYNDPSDIVWIRKDSLNKTLSIYHDPNNFFNGTFSNPNYEYGTQGFRFVAYDHNNPNDSAFVDIKFAITTVGLNKISKEDYTVTVGPNPSNGQFNVNYDFTKNFSTKVIEIYDMLGQQVKAIPLNANKGTVNVTASELNSGIYFYNFRLDGKLTESQKLIITK
jgi:hypothetical protein